ncbi:hypothetical protein [Bifidobacterium sp. ESL0764]|uniref:hypothetical protein n=1 Tax=Bifidobacterium sp. ESL0764 TaxID=2983228 RepID=UPI0023F8838C|nr:hypothetical protein [Bifidobacterium sp. ESL0764]WEV65754.1 hypothetical protein OZX71_08435 [Bifidobacterium sp. ESL0764]
MAKKRYAIVASFAAACMMMAGIGVGSASAAETPTAKDAPAATQQTQSVSKDAAQSSDAKVDANATTADSSNKSDATAQAKPQTQAQPKAQAQSEQKPSAQPQPAVQPRETPSSSSDGVGVSGIKITDVKVTDVGAHTANLSFDYQITWPNGHPANHPIDGETDRIAPIISFTNVTSMTARSAKGGCTQYKDPTTHQTTTNCRAFSGYNPGKLDIDHNDAHIDDNMTAQTYAQDYGSHYVGDYSNADSVFDGQGQQFTRYGFSNADYKFGYPYDASKKTGHFDMSLIGLEPGTHYENQNVNANGQDLTYADPYVMLDEHAKELVAQGKKDQTVNTHIMQLLVGVEYMDFYDQGNGVSYTEGVPSGNFVQIPAFTTKAAPTAPASGDLNDGNKGDVSAPSNPVAGSPSRIYIHNLSEACKAGADDTADSKPSCFWAGYIYSDPTQLTDPSGAPYLTVKSDDKGYYVEPLLPSDKTGVHKIALLDENGALAGWTTVNIATPPTPPSGSNPTDPAAGKTGNKADNGKKLANTGASVDYVALAAAASLTLAAGVSLARRRRA